VLRRHDADAGGDADLLAAKARLRDEVWGARLTRARHPRRPRRHARAHDRVPV